MYTRKLYEVDDDAHREDMPEGESTAAYYTNLRDARRDMRARTAWMKPDNEVYIDRVTVSGRTQGELLLRVLNGRGYIVARDRIEQRDGCWVGDPCDECGVMVMHRFEVDYDHHVCLDCYGVAGLEGA